MKSKRYPCSSSSSDDEDDPSATATMKKAPDGTGVGEERPNSIVDDPSASATDLVKKGVAGEEGDGDNKIGEEEDGIDSVTETEKPAEREQKNPGDEEAELDSDSDEEGTVAYLPKKMYIEPEFYKKSMKIATNCFIEEVVRNLEDILDEEEIKWFHDHPQFRHFFHMTREVNHKTMGFYLLLIRSAKIVKENEIWFIVNGVPIRYSMGRRKGRRRRRRD